MKIEFLQEKLEPATKVVTSLSSECKETEKGFLFPISLSTPNGSTPAVAIECEILDCEAGVLRVAVKSANYNTAGELTESTLLNHVLVDLKQFVPASNESEITLTSTSAIPKTKPAAASS